MKKQFKQAGFTLIELVVVIVILGILAATAVPKFADMSNEAKQAKADGVAGAVAASASIRYAQHQVSNSIAYDPAMACGGSAGGGTFSYLESQTVTGCTGSGTASCQITCDTKTSGTITLPQ